MRANKSKPLAVFHSIFPVGHLVISVFFLLCAIALLGFGGLQLWRTIQPDDIALTERVDAVLEALALLTVALATLELAQTIVEEEVQREAQMSAPTRVRRFLSRFMVVLVVALSIETLVLVFKFSHETPEYLPYAAWMGLAIAGLLAGWGYFVRANRSAEELEPEAMQEAKREDKKIQRER